MLINRKYRIDEIGQRGRWNMIRILGEIEWRLGISNRILFLDSRYTI